MSIDRSALRRGRSTSRGLGRGSLAFATALAALLPAAPALAASLPLDLPDSAAIRFTGAGDSGAGNALLGDCDLTGDGRDDLTVGALSATVGGVAGTGIAYVIPGTAARGAGSYDLDGGSPPAGAIAIEGNGESQAGAALDCAGDVNGDGIDDLLVAAPYESGGTGRVYVVFGSRALSPSTPIRLGALGSGGFMVVGNDDTSLGTGVAGLGDLDGDGKDEIAIGDFYGDVRGTDVWPGTVYVIRGTSATTTIELRGQPQSTLLRIHGAAADDELSTVAGSGDVNGDGTPDLLVGAPGHDGPHGANSGAAYVVSGRARGEIDLGAAAGGGSGILFKVWGDDAARRNGSAARAGYALAGAGDVNGDGKADLAISSTTGTISGGEGYDVVDVVYGKADAAAVDLDAPGDAAYRLRGTPRLQTLDGFGRALAPAGDVNGDGRADLAVGAPSAAGPAGANSGAVYLFYGLAQPRTIDVVSRACAEGVRLFATSNGNGFGTGVALAGASFGDAGAPYLFGGGSGTVRGVPLTPVADGCGRDPDPEPTALDVDWGLRESFRRYVSNGFNPANPVAPIVATGGATCEVDTVKGGCDPRVRLLPSDSLPRRALRWTPIGAGATDGSDTTVATIGTVTFSYPGHFFRLRVQDPWLAIAGGTVTLRARVDLDVTDGFAGARPVDVRLPFGTFPLDGQPVKTAQSIVWRTQPGTLTAEAGAALGGFLPTGAELDPVTIAIPRSLGPLGEEPTVPVERVDPPRVDPPRVDPPKVAPPRATAIATISALARRATVRGASTVRLGRVLCRTRSCAVSAPRSVRLKIAARKGVRTPRGPLARVTVPARVANGKRGEVRLVVSRAAARALAGRRATARVTVVVKADGKRLAKTLTVTLVGRSARVRR